MNPQIKKRLVEALLSGDFKQSFFFLKNETGFCCLGVLTKLAEDDGVDLPRYWGSSSALCNAVQSWSGLDAPLPRARGCYLHNMNDRMGFSFSEIAEEIEKHL